MNPLALLKHLFSNIPADKHTVSVNGVRKGPVTKAVAKLSGTNVAFHYEFKSDNDKTVKVEGTCPLADAGKQGGADTIKVDGADVSNDDIVLSNRLTGKGLVIVIEFEFEQAGQAMRIRFDAVRGFVAF